MLHVLIRCAAILLLLVEPAAARAAVPALVLEGGAGIIDAWPAVAVLAEGDGPLTLEQVSARRGEFVAPEVPHANLGVRHEALWLRVPLQVAAGSSARWMLSVDYASIDRIEVNVLDGEQVVQQVLLGRSLPFSQRPWPASAHAAALDLQPNRAYDLFLRVETASTMVVPLTLATPEAFHAREARVQVLQGLMTGAAVCLLFYSVAHWVGLRDPMFLQYALTLAGTTLFFVSYFGLGPQHLWGDNAWLTTRAAPLAVLLGGLPGGFLFIHRALSVGEIAPRIARALRAGAGASALIGLAFAAGIVDYRFAQVGATLLGPLPMLLAIPVAWTRARCGERVGLYMLIGWSVYGLGTLTMAGLLRGFVSSNFWTQHAFQFGSLFEMLMWMRVLGLRIEGLRASAQRAQIERDALRSLAHSDSLTNLPNRRGLNEALTRVLSASASDRLTAVYLLDLDGFKTVNDRLGHDAGDALLIGVARRLRSLLRSSDVVARLGGDEFVVVAAGLRGDDEARLLGQKLIDAFDRPFEVNGQPSRVGLTIGYALAPLDGRDAAGLLKRADAAMYAGKRAGRHCLRRDQAHKGALTPAV